MSSIIKEASLIKQEQFARKIFNLAVEDKLTVSEISGALDMVNAISKNSIVDAEAIEKFDFSTIQMCCCTNN